MAGRAKVVVVGATGQLGGDLVDVFGASGRWEVVGLSHEQVEVSRWDSVKDALEAIKPDVVVNAAAFTRVDACESEVEAAFRVNAVGALHVARATEAAGALCVYISTDYVFDGRRGKRVGGWGSERVENAAPLPYTEQDPPHPINVYGASKLAGEVLTAQGASKYLVVRVASLFGRRGARGKGGNFVTTVLARAKAGEPLRVVDDIVMSPTYTLDAARAVERLVRAGAAGVVHVVNSGMCSWYEFACAIVRRAGLQARVEPTSSDAYPMVARRPKFSALSNGLALQMVGEGVLRRWEDALAEYVPGLL